MVVVRIAGGAVEIAGGGGEEGIVGDGDRRGGGKELKRV